MQKPKVILLKGTHYNEEIIKIDFEKNILVLEHLRQLRHVRWSKTLGSWYVAVKICPPEQIVSVLRAVAEVDDSAFRVSLPVSEPVITTILPTKNENVVFASRAEFNVGHQEKISDFRKWLSSRRYSESTINTYCDALSMFLKYFGGKPVEAISNQDLIEFNNNYILKNKLSSSFQNQVVNAVKLFFRTIEDRMMDPDLIHRPKRAKLLPNVLSKEEVKEILGCLANIKHKAMLSLIYSCGLRRAELLNLKVSDIDSKRNLIIIKQSKGRKDRIVPLSVKILALLRDYYHAYKPKFWLFEGQDKSGKYDESSLAAVLKQAVIKSGNPKPVTLHWLRHSYATHLLENGTDLRYIQEILGHSRSTTTEIYTHVSNKSIQKVISPFDSL
ncbi:MAG: integrase [Bacteroidetes bacterium]|nr:integrase [Bacteroidota bacterium]